MQGPGDQITERLRKLGWTQADLARIIGRTTTCVSEVVNGKRSITIELAALLGAAFGDLPGFWFEQDAIFRARTESPTDVQHVARTASLYRVAPIREMQRRGWIRETNDLEHVAHDLKRFFGVKSLENAVEFPVSTRRVDSLADLSSPQRAWIFRARNIAAQLPANNFSDQSSEKVKHELRALATHPKEARHVPEVMEQFGIRFVIVEPIHASYIDGAAFWLDDSSPVIALSLRYDRIDHFWYTLMHELAHIHYRDAISVDTHLVGDGQTPPLLKDEIERRADAAAATSLIAHDDLDSFMRRVGPMYSKPQIVGFARRIQVHPAIVVGQLQHRGEIGWHAHRGMLAKIRTNVVETSFVDGWGRSLPPSFAGMNNE